MFKYVIAVAFLSYVALGDNINPFNRGLTITETTEWDADQLALCTETCKEYCEDCLEPKRCDETAKLCGTKSIDPNMHQCTVDEICVPKECECK